MAQINKPDTYFNTKLYTGNGGTNAITGVGFQPDFTWIKTRSGTSSHALFDAVRGVQKRIFSNTNDLETTYTNALASFDSDGFTLGDHGAINLNASTNVSWNWLASNTTASNTDGSITSTVSASTTSGFSIVSYTGNGSAGATIGHGLSATPSVIFVKGTSLLSDWSSYHSVLGNTGYMRLNNTNAFTTASTYWNNTSPNSSVFTVGTTGNINGSGNSYIAYCFAEKKGFSKFGSYTGNGSADGTFVYTGFKPAFVLAKASSTTSNWTIIDNKRDTYNVATKQLSPDLSNAESSTDSFDFLSNGFKVRSPFGSLNSSGATYIYMAIAESPLVGTNNIPATAR